MKNIQEILNHGNMIPTCNNYSDSSKTANKFGLYHTGINSYLAPVEKTYYCPKCQDREIIEIGEDSNRVPIYSPCSCKTEKIMTRKLKSSGLRQHQLGYKLEDYANNEGNQNMLEGVKRYLEVWPKLINSDSTAKGFFLAGNAGIGKTMLSCIIAKDMLDKGISVIFVSSADLLAELRQAQFSNDEEGIEGKITTLAKTPALILDDISKEKPTEWVQSMYYRLIDLRYRNNLLTGFNANYFPQELNQRLGDFGEATVSRILGMTKDHFLYAKDLDHRIVKNL